jgi:mannitol-specific phosphotransferase system IIBC component
MSSEINYTTIKTAAITTLKRAITIQDKINSLLMSFWVKLLDQQKDNRITRGLKILIKNSATALFLNTLLFAAIGHIFGGLINNILFYASALNIIVFLARILKWEDK